MEFADHVTLETGPRGQTVMVEPEQRPGLDRRVFFYEASGDLMWAHYADWRAHGEKARFYCHISKDLPATMTGGAGR